MKNVPEEIRVKIEDKLKLDKVFQHEKERRKDYEWAFKAGAEYGYSLLNEKEVPDIEDIIYEYLQHLHKNPITKSYLPLNDEVEHISEWWEDNKYNWLKI